MDLMGPVNARIALRGMGFNAVFKTLEGREMRKRLKLQIPTERFNPRIADALTEIIKVGLLLLHYHSEISTTASTAERAFFSSFS